MDKFTRKKEHFLKKRQVFSRMMTLVFLFFLFCFLSGCSPKARAFSLGTEEVNRPSYKKKKEWNGDYLWYGGIKWRILQRYEEIFLLADHIPEEYQEEWGGMNFALEKLEDLEENPSWDNSPIREYLNADFYASAFTPEERDAMLCIFQDSSQTMPKDKIFLLEYEDAISESYGFSADDYVQRSYDKDWWLLPENSVHYLYVASGGAVMEMEDRIGAYLDKALRPAFYLDPDCLVFLRDAAAAEKFSPSSVLSDTRMKGERSGEWVPVLSSAAQHVEIEAVELEEDVCTVSYRNASAGPGQYLSAMVTDGEETLRYYGPLAEISSQTEGTVTVQLPDSYKKSWNLWIFSERPGEGKETSYASEPVVVLEGKIPVTELPVSEGRCDPDQEPESLDVIINRIYDPYLNWNARDYEAAGEEEKLHAATAALLYTALCQEATGNALTNEEIRDGVEYAEEHPEDAQAMADIFFTQADTYGLSLKETMDRNFGQNLSGAYEGEVDLFEYTKYLDYTGAMYLEADREEQENILIASELYLEKYRLEQEVSREYADEIAELIRHPEAGSEETVFYVETLKLYLETSCETYPDIAVRELMNYTPGFE